MIDKELKDSYIEYTLLYDTVASRITIDEAVASAGRLKLMKSIYWEYDSLPHDIICYSDCDSMEDIARYYIEETGQLGEVPSNLQNYIDYQSLGRDMEIEGNYLVTSHGVF